MKQHLRPKGLWLELTEAMQPELEKDQRQSPAAEPGWAPAYS